MENDQENQADESGKEVDPAGSVAGILASLANLAERVIVGTWFVFVMVFILLYTAARVLVRWFDG